MLINTIEIRVRYAETDQMKRVYYSRYFEYFEVGRASLFREYEIPYGEIESRLGILLPVIETYAKIYHPAKFDDLLILKTIAKEKPTVRMRIDYELYDKDLLITEGYTVLAFLRASDGKPTRPPIEILQKFEKSI